MLDSLTGVLNRDALLYRMDTELERARRDGSRLAVAMADIDGFKRVNDDHGHLAGDAILAAVAGYDALADAALRCHRTLRWR